MSRRLSGYLSSQLANPAYSGMLGGGVAQGMQGISDAFNSRRKRQAQQSIMAMLSQGDPTDPRVVQSAQMVGQQMHQDPLEVQAMIDQAQQMRRRKEENARRRQSEQRAVESHKMNKTLYEYQVKAKQLEEKRKNAIKAGMSSYNKDPSKLDIILQNSGEFRQDVHDAILAEETRVTQWAELKEHALDAKPLDESSLNVIKGTPNMEKAVAFYEERVKNKDNIRLAKKDLLTAWKNVSYQNIFQKADGELPAVGHIKAAKEAVDNLDKGFWRELFSDEKNIPEEIKYAVAVQLAKDTEAGKAPTPEHIRKIASDIVASQGPATPPTLTTQAEVDALPDGTRFVWTDGQTYTKGR